MREDLRDRIGRAVAGSGGTSAPLPVASPSAGAPAASFEAAFLRKAERVVYPAMLEVGRQVERHGRFFSIELMIARTTCHGVAIPTSVQMNLFRRSRTTNFKNACPHFNVICDTAERRVLFRQTVPSAAGEKVTDCGRCTLEQLGRDLVQDHLVAALDTILHA